MSADHNAEAVANLDIAGEYPFGHDDEERRERYHLAAAQVHAALYAAEQTAALVDATKHQTQALVAVAGVMMSNGQRTELARALDALTELRAQS